jgi:Fur family iron response transcriptional regulator
VLFFDTPLHPRLKFNVVYKLHYCRKITALWASSTPQRVGLAQLLFGAGNRHGSAEALYAEARAAPCRYRRPPSTTLSISSPGQDCCAKIAIEGSRSYFDTNTSNHFHYFLEDRENLSISAVTR